MFIVLCALLLAPAWGDAQYVKSVKGGYKGAAYPYNPGANLPNFYGNSNQTHQYGSQGMRNFASESSHHVSNIDYEVGVCYVEVPTATLAKNPAHLPAGNGSRPDLSRIRSCCRGYIRNIHNYRICDPVCTEECVNGLCTAPETCSCFPDHVRNLAGICFPTCPIGCQNGYCSGGECMCKSGYKLDVNGKFCVPMCRENCGGHGNCTEPNTCVCKEGYHPTAEGNCKPSCLGCEPAGRCVLPNVCQYPQGQSPNISPPYNPSHQPNPLFPGSQVVTPNPNTVHTYPISPKYPGQYSPSNPGQYIPGNSSQPGLNNTNPGQRYPGYPHPDQSNSVYPSIPSDSNYQGQTGSKNATHPVQFNTTKPYYPSQPGSHYPSYPGQPGSSSHYYPGQQGPNNPSHPGEPGSSKPYYPGQPGLNNPYYPGQPGSNNIPGQSGPNGPYYPGPTGTNSSSHPGQPGPNSPYYPGQSGSNGPYYPGQPGPDSPYYPGQPGPDIPYYPGQPGPNGPYYPGQSVPNNPSHPGQPGSSNPYYPGQSTYPHHRGQSNYSVQQEFNQSEYQGHSFHQEQSENYNQNEYYGHSFHQGQSGHHKQNGYEEQSGYHKQAQNRTQSGYNPYGERGDVEPYYPGSQMYNHQTHNLDIGNLYQCSEECINGLCVDGNRCRCNPGYVQDRNDPTERRCVPHCAGGCSNGVCSAPNSCICNAGYYIDHSVKGRPSCVKRIRRSTNVKPTSLAELLIFDIPNDY